MVRANQHLAPHESPRSGISFKVRSQTMARRIAANFAKLPVLLLPLTGQDVPERPTHRDDEGRDNNNDYKVCDIELACSPYC